MVLLYSAPPSVENEAQARSYLNAIFKSLDRMSPNDFEAEHIWEAFKREWKYKSWPTPVELCARLTKFRQSQASVAKAAGDKQHEPGAVAQELEHRPYRHGEFMAALKAAQDMAASKEPGAAIMGRLLIRCGEALLKNRDDSDRPRFREAAE
jgi:hypothetical protein